MPNRTSNRLLISVVIGLIVALMPAYSATIITYTDQSIFNSVTQGVITLTFDDQTYPGYVSGSNGYWIGPAGSLVHLVGAGSSNYYTALTKNPSSVTDWGTGAVLEGGYAGNSDSSWQLHIDLPVASTAIALNLMTKANDHSPVTGGSLNITLSSGDVAGPIKTAAWDGTVDEDNTSPNSAGVKPTWIGLTSDVAFTSLDIHTLDGSVPIIDNFAFGSTLAAAPPPETEAPEAATMVLIGTGLLAIRLVRRNGGMKPA